LGLEPNSFGAQRSTTATVLTVSLLVPLIETAIGQWLPYEIVRKFNASIGVRILVLWVTFLAIHLRNSPTSIFVDGYIGGLLLSLTFNVWAQRSRLAAYSMTFVCHG